MKKVLRVVAILTIFIAVTTFSIDPGGGSGGQAKAVKPETVKLT